MMDQTGEKETKTTPRRRRARASDADAEVNPPGEPSARRVAPGWERRSKEMPGRKGTLKQTPWIETAAPGPEEDDEPDEDAFPRPGRPPGPARHADRVQETDTTS